MTTFDMTTTEGLRDACSEAGRRLDQEGEKKIIAEHSEFLRRVRDASPQERESQRFQRLIWEENPLDDINSHGDFDLSAALKDQDFARALNGLVDTPLPTGLQERNTELHGLLREAMELASRYVPPTRSGRRYWPVWKTHRAFAALFPRDIVPYYHYSLYQPVAKVRIQGSTERA